MKRKIYAKLLEWKDAAARSPLILKETRQVGKSYILQAFGEKEFSEKGRQDIRKTAEQDQEPGYSELSALSRCKDMIGAVSSVI
ncbi:MAG: hypothetical protein JJW03_00385 [Desulfosarcina sp.]|nr:hypothetical protein [Desulfobacterales bacterium]